MLTEVKALLSLTDSAKELSINLAIQPAMSFFQKSDSTLEIRVLAGHLNRDDGVFERVDFLGERC